MKGTILVSSQTHRPVICSSDASFVNFARGDAPKTPLKPPATPGLKARPQNLLLAPIARVESAESDVTIMRDHLMESPSTRIILHTKPQPRQPKQSTSKAPIQIFNRAAPYPSALQPSHHNPSTLSPETRQQTPPPSNQKMEWAKQKYNSTYNDYMPWIEDKVLGYWGENKTSYTAKGFQFSFHFHFLSLASPGTLPSSPNPTRYASTHQC